MVDRLCHSQLGSAYTVASIGYRVYPDADTTGQVRRKLYSKSCIAHHDAVLEVYRTRPGSILVVLYQKIPMATESHCWDSCS